MSEHTSSTEPRAIEYRRRRRRVSRVKTRRVLPTLIAIASVIGLFLFAIFALVVESDIGSDQVSDAPMNRPAAAIKNGMVDLVTSLPPHARAIVVQRFQSSSGVSHLRSMDQTETLSELLHAEFLDMPALRQWVLDEMDEAERHEREIVDAWLTQMRYMDRQARITFFETYKQAKNPQ